MVNSIAVDIIFCVETTSKMAIIGADVKKEIKKSIDKIYDAMLKRGELYNDLVDCDRIVEQYRIKFILFKDFNFCDNAIIETDFYDALLNIDEIDAFIDNICFEGGNGYCNALETLAMAIKSKWETKWARKRHAIVLFSQSKVRPLGLKYNALLYPTGMPNDIAELGAWWHGLRGVMPETMFSPRSGRLISFVPNVEPWNAMQVWGRYWPAFVPSDSGLDDDDFENIVSFLFAGCGF